MNGLSWLIYLAGALGNLQGVGIAVVIISGAVAALSTLASIICNFDNDMIKYQTRWIKTLQVSGMLLALGTVFITIVPSERTVLLIAASQTGEQILQTPVGTEAGDLALDTLKLLREKINDQLSPDSEK